jgi:thiol-disulfide isomerase/thioredoxin
MAFLRRAKTLLRWVLPVAIPLVILVVAYQGFVRTDTSLYRSLSAQNTDYWDAMKRTGEHDADARLEIRQAIADYAQRRHHFNEMSLSRASWWSFLLMRDDPGVESEELAEAVRAMVSGTPFNPAQPFAFGAMALAEREGYMAEARELVDSGFASVQRTVAERREDGRYDTDEEVEEALENLGFHLHNALGWVHFHDGQLNEAEFELFRAAAAAPEEGHILYNLGRLFEEKASRAGAASSGPEDEEEVAGLWNRAEEYYAKGTLVVWRWEWENPNEGAIRALYKGKYGGLAGFDEHYAAVTHSDREAKRLEILAGRIEEPKSMPPFVLANLDGEMVSSGELAGKVLVINFWGTWCPPCVKEMPELQLFSERYRGSEDIAVLTIACRDPGPEHVRDWMEKKGYDFPALMNDEYARPSGVRGYPTTWFVDREGNIAFEKVGTSFRLLEEFTWRAEALAEEQN